MFASDWSMPVHSAGTESQTSFKHRGGVKQARESERHPELSVMSPHGSAAKVRKRVRGNSHRKRVHG